MDKELENKIIRILNSEDIDKEALTLSFDERVKVISCNNNFACKVLLESLSKDTVFISEDESLQLYQQYKSNPNDSLNIIDFCNYPFIKYPESLDEAFKEYFLDCNDEFIFGRIKNREVKWDVINECRITNLFVDSIDDDVLLERMIMDKKYFDFHDRIFKLFSNDSYREKYFKKMIRFANADTKSYLISCFQSDELKEKYIKEVPVNHRGNIVKSFKSKELRKKYFSSLIDMKADIILSFEKDEEKIEYLERFKLTLSQEDKGKIIANLENMDNILKYIRIISKEKGVASFLEYFNIERDKDFFIKLTSLIHNDNLLYNIIPSCFYEDAEYRDTLLLIINRIKNKDVLCRMLTGWMGFGYGIEKYIFPKLDQHHIKMYIKADISLADCHALMLCEDKKLVIESLRHHENMPEYNEEIRPLFEFVSKHYNCNLDHLISLAKICGCNILRSIENENILNAINLNEEDFKKYLRIFDEKNKTIDMNGILSIVNMALQKKFSLDHPEEIEIFIRTLHNIEDGNINEAIARINQVISIVDISKYDIDYNTLVNGLISQNKEIIIKYNKITYEYLKYKRNEFVNNDLKNTLSKVTSLHFEGNSLVKYVFKTAPIDYIKKLIINEMWRSGDYFSFFKDKEELIDKLIRFKKSPSSFGPLSEDMKQNMKKFNELCANIFDYKFNECNLPNEVSREYDIYDINEQNIISLMENINVLKLRDTIFCDEVLYEELIFHLEKYGMIGWGDRFSFISSQADIDFGDGLVGSIISNYEFISKTSKEKQKENKRFTLLDELNLADCLDSNANIYSILIGTDDFKLIKRNPSPNSSPKDKKYRINKALEYLKQMHQRKCISVPSIDENVILKNGKKINIMLGNTNDPINLTYGERTGACMRIGGAGSSLFEFCLTNENGFHISFNDPITGQLVSRVSCFRNGNTLFLNQLRYSLSEKYSNGDIVEACEIISKKIIELTKQSKFPIENVVASNGYALSTRQNIDLKCSNIKKGFPDFYSDVSEKAVVIATSNNGELVEVKTNPNATEKYPIGRSKVKKYELKSANNAIKRIEALDLFYSEIDIEEISIEDRTVEFAYVGEDWYIAKLMDGKIISYIQKNSLNPSKAQDEMNKYMTLLDREKTYGGILE